MKMKAASAIMAWRGAMAKMAAAGKHGAQHQNLSAAA